MESAQPIVGAGHSCKAPLRGQVRTFRPIFCEEKERARAETTSFSGLFFFDSCGCLGDQRRQEWSVSSCEVALEEVEVALLLQF